MIKFHEPYVSKKLEKNYSKLTKKNLFGSTYFREICTEILKEEFGYKNFLLTNSATSALELISILLKDQEFQKLKLPSYTFSSTANAFLRSGFDIEFIDIDVHNSMIDIDNLQKLEQSELLGVVHYAGSSLNFEKLYEKMGNEVNFIEDAAQAFGVKFNDENVGQIGLAGCISFHPTKNIHSDFGGMALLSDQIDFEKAKFVYERGTDRSKVVAGLKNKYEWVELGASFEITESSCAVLESQLSDYQIIYQIRKELYLRYVENLKDFAEENNFYIQDHPSNFEPNYHSFYLIIQNNRDNLIKYLIENGIQAYIGYVPLHSSIFSKNKGLYEDLEVTDFVGERILRLPLHTNLKPKDIDYICKNIKNYYKTKE